MFYRPADGHGLPRNPFNALITPRPIGWISTRASDGSDNLAPYSFFNAVAYAPPQVMFASTSTKPDRPRGKDSLGNIDATGVFCVNIVGQALAEAMNLSSGAYARDQDEFALAGLDKTQCQTIDCARVAQAPAALECSATQVIALAGDNNYLVLGEVTGVHIDDTILNEGLVDPRIYRPLARMGYMDYTSISDIFAMARPGQ